MQSINGIILVTVPGWRFSDKTMESLRQHSGGREVVYAPERSDMERLADSAEIMIGFGPWDLPAKMPGLRWFQAWSAGVDGVVEHPELKNHPVIITNTSGMHRESITEHVFAMILARNRCFPKIFAAQKRHEWIDLVDPETHLLSGKTMLILGYGQAGEQIAIAARGFGVKVIGVRRRRGTSSPDLRIETLDKLPELLGEADYVVNILPFTLETQGVMGRKEFGLMKEGAVYVNVGRGKSTDEDALLDALRSGRLSAALLDVTAVEPLPPDSPFWDMENVIVTPHYAGMRPDYPQKALEITIDNMERYNRGEPLLHVVNKETGY
jgi:phosphoglycerate dehydrogenase-like enzyme